MCRGIWCIVEGEKIMRFNIDVTICINQLIFVHIQEFNKIYNDILDVQSKITGQLGKNDMPVQLAIDMMVMADYKGRIDKLHVRLAALIDLVQLYIGTEYDLKELLESTIERCREDIQYIKDGEEGYSFSQSDLCRRYQRKQDELIVQVAKILMNLENALKND